MPQMEQLQSDVTKIREQLAGQVQLLNQISAQLQQNAASSAQQSMQLSNLSAEFLVMKNDLASWKVEIGSLNAWRNDSLNIFVPRREHEALHHEERIADLENWRRALADKSGEDRFNFLQWLVSNGLSILIFLIGAILTIYGYLHH